MNKLVRMSYGRSGSRLDRVLVSAPGRQVVPVPRWLKILEVMFWILIPVLVFRYAVPPTPRQMTVIDVSRLMEKPRIEEPRQQILEPKPKLTPPPVRPEKPRVEAKKPVERPSAPPRDVAPPTIVRPTAPRVADSANYQPRITRERVQLETEAGAPAATRIRRETSVSDAPSGGVKIARSRGAAAVDVPVASGYRVAPLRRAPSAGEGSGAGGTGGGTGKEVVLRRGTRSGRSYGYPGASEGGGPIVTASRGRATATGTGGGEGSSSVGLVRGVSLMSLEICSSPQEEEDHIRAVLGVVGSRQSCASDKGEFQFKGTKRISSFNLMIYPAKGRRPSNRCEELEYAYRCLTTH